MAPALRNFLLLAVSLLATLVTAGAQPHLSPAAVIRIADAQARSALQRDLHEFHRSSPRYSRGDDIWSVIYRNTAGTAPSTIEIQVSDHTQRATAIFGDESR
jgi:hypothetical protein